MSGNLRKDFQRRNHRERAQPEERQKWGLLEKRKDYKLRAADHKTKVKKLKQLKQKALEKNPDEFSFKMLSSSVDSAGRKVASRGNTALSMDVVKLLKTQDANYIRTMLQMVKKERRELEERILLGEEGVEAVRDGEEGGRSGKHMVFVGEKEDQDAFRADEWFGTEEEFVDRAWNRPRKAKDLVVADAEDDEEEGLQSKKLSKKQQEAEALAVKEQRSLANKRAKTHERALARLEAVKAKERDLRIAEEELEKQRAKMNNTIGGTNKNGVKFKVRERKR
ncbi:small-subunit processome, partial [Aaosphaeria arxii CBS 175.79]